MMHSPGKVWLGNAVHGDKPADIRAPAVVVVAEPPSNWAMSATLTRTTVPIAAPHRRMA